jgi:S1-C subfamily serine protease
MTGRTIRGMHHPWFLLAAVLACAPMAAGAADYKKLFAKVDPAVAVIYTVERGVAAGGKPGQVSQSGLGSGVLVTTRGYVITAAHVVQTADLVEVEFSNGFRTTAAVTASNPGKDLALLKLDEVPGDITPMRLADSDDVAIGEEVFVIGAPYGFSHTLSVGHISGRHEPDAIDSNGPQAETFQTDAVINQGNSGGPMFNSRGEVIGIVSYILSQSGGFEGLGFVITSNEVVATLFEQPMAWSGMSGVLVEGDIAVLLNVPQKAGYLVQKVALNSPAQRAGLRPSLVPARIADRELLIGGDIILSVDGIEISRQMLKDIRARWSDDTARGTVDLTLLRAGKVWEISVPVARPFN